MSIETSKTFNTTSLSDEQFRSLLDQGFTVKDIESFSSQLEYRKEYNKRPDVVAKRKVYSQLRNTKMKMLREILKKELE
jgi:hypothetical protein